MLRISKEVIKHLERRHWGRLWGQRYMIEPVFIRACLGDGNQLIGLSMLDTRPNYYLVRIDSSWSLNNYKTPCFYDHIDDLYDLIEDQVGPRFSEDDDGNEVDFPWPAFDCGSGSSWWPANDLLESAREAVKKKKSKKPRYI